jgi:hypothetical protein
MYLLENVSTSVCNLSCYLLICRVCLAHPTTHESQRDAVEIQYYVKIHVSILPILLPMNLNSIHLCVYIYLYCLYCTITNSIWLYVYTYLYYEKAPRMGGKFEAKICPLRSD